MWWVIFFSIIFNKVNVYLFSCINKAIIYQMISFGINIIKWRASLSDMCVFLITFDIFHFVSCYISFNCCCAICMRLNLFFLYQELVHTDHHVFFFHKLQSLLNPYLYKCNVLFKTLVIYVYFFIMRLMSYQCLIYKITKEIDDNNSIALSLIKYIDPKPY